MNKWISITVPEIYDELTQSSRRHVAFIIVSFVSVGSPCNCLSVDLVQKAVLGSLLNALHAEDDLYAEINDYLVQLEKPLEKPSEKRSFSEFGKSLQDLPFEQFMACLYHPDHNSAKKVIDISHGGGRKPNTNHLALAHLVKTLLECTHIECVSILTTNYDKAIEYAFEEAFHIEQWAPVEQLPIPRFELLPELAHGKRLRYVKLHGCVEIPQSQVYTKGQMGRLIANRSWIKDIDGWLNNDSRPIDIAMSAGYGFRDPDLYPLFFSDPAHECPTTGILGNALLIRNERDRFEESHSLIGRAVLQLDAFGLISNERRKLCCTTLLKNAARSESSSIFIDLLALFLRSNTKYDIPDWPCFSQLDDILLAIHERLATLQDEKKMLFWGRLCNACGRPEGRISFKRTLDITNSKEVSNEIARAYLYSFGNANEWEGGMNASNALIHKSKSIDLRILGYAYRSFMLTIGDNKNPLLAMQDLRLGKRLLKKSKKDVRQFFNHYEMHFWVKAIEAAYQGSKDWGRALGLHSVLKKRARKWASVIAAAQEDLVENGDPESIGDTLEILAEILIMAGESDQALHRAAEAKVWRSFIGRMSNAAQADRLLGWICLTQGEKTKRQEALTHFARGFQRSLGLPHESSLAEKLGANLVRVLWVDNLSALRELNGADVEQGRIEDICWLLQNRSPTSDDQKRDIAKYVLFLFGTRGAALKAEIAQLSDLKHYPIYLPLRS